MGQSTPTSPEATRNLSERAQRESTSKNHLKMSLQVTNFSMMMFLIFSYCKSRVMLIATNVEEFSVVN